MYGSEALLSISHWSLLRRVLISMAACSIEQHWLVKFSETLAIRCLKRKDVVRSDCGLFVRVIVLAGKCEMVVSGHL